MQQELERLVRLVGTDPGFYVLALHSFVEHYIRDVIRASDAERFNDLVWDYRERLLEEANGGFVQGLSCLAGLGRQHKFTNMVRHAFDELETADAAAATHLFLVFCSLVGLNGIPELHRLESSRELWEERRSLAEQSTVLRGVQDELQRLQSRNSELLQQLDEYARAQNEVSRLQNDIRRFSLELQDARLRVRTKDERVDELRAEKRRLTSERKELLRKMQDYRELESYISSLGRFSVYTRTRMDYERGLMRLTPEQEDAVQAIDRQSDFLVRGSAGTGKSLILIEALKRSLQVGELPFESGPDKRAVLLTFTRTLAKFEDYITEVLGVKEISGLVMTVDTFILERLKRINPAYRFNFEIVGELSSRLNTTGFFDDVELATELEVFLFGSFVTREEYTSEVVPRHGMRRRLSRGQREAVWSIREQVAQTMEERGEFSRNYARIRILNFLSDADEAGRERLIDVRTIYLDETQDLTPGDLITLKSLTTGHLVMASDLQQSIYGVSSPFVRAGINISGRTRVLRTNFRNTRQIHALAQSFLPADEQKLFAFRDGPIPEIYCGEDASRLLDLLMQKLQLFLQHLQYEPENICILAPHTVEVNRVAGELVKVELPASVITEREFEFTQAGSLRLSTLHSSKGLDFPVVLLFLPYLNRREKFDAETTDRLLRNLVHVGITRAMEHLNVFVSPGDDPVLHDIVGAFEQIANRLRLTYD